MKYSFKDGDWFDARKLSPWQKQWCLDNLDFVGQSGRQFANSFFNLFVYRVTWCDKPNGFCSTQSCVLSKYGELSFNDFYWGGEFSDEEEKSSNVFTTPKYVTFDKNQDIMDVFLGKLEHDKDYKVVESKPVSTGGNKLTLENGITAHDSYFYPNPTWQDMTYIAPEEDDSFDNLVYVRPEEFPYSYKVLPLNKLSEEQVSFLEENLIWDHNGLMRKERSLGIAIYGCDDWFYCSTISDEDIKISFNDIFVPKE